MQKRQRPIVSRPPPRSIRPKMRWFPHRPATRGPHESPHHSATACPETCLVERVRGRQSKILQGKASNTTTIHDNSKHPGIRRGSHREPAGKPAGPASLQIGVLALGSAVAAFAGEQDNGRESCAKLDSANYIQASGGGGSGADLRGVEPQHAWRELKGGQRR